MKDKPREEYKLIEKLPLFDGLYFETFGVHIDEASDKQLEQMLEDVIKRQLELTGAKYFDYYLLHAIYDDRHTESPRLGDISLYKRLVKVLLKYKEKGTIKHIGFSGHIDFPTCYYFVTEMKKEFGDDFDTAEISYNVLNSNGISNNDGFFSKFYGVMVWDSIGIKGLKFLKENNMYIINCMPTESGRLGAVCQSPDFYDWNYRFIRETKEIDCTLIGTSHVEHFDQFYDIYVDEKDLKSIPDMRIIGSGTGHCSE